MFWLQDSCYHVRLKIAAKLHKSLVHLRLPLEYMSIFSLAANDPLRERRAFIKKCIQINVQKRREYLKQNSTLGGKCPVTFLVPLWICMITVMIQSFRTDRSGQTVQTQIRLLLEEQSDQGLHCLLFHLHLFDEIP